MQSLTFLQASSTDAMRYVDTRQVSNDLWHGIQIPRILSAKARWQGESKAHTRGKKRAPPPRDSETSKPMGKDDPQSAQTHTNRTKGLRLHNTIKRASERDVASPNTQLAQHKA